jgi:hypothetical protein
MPVILLSRGTMSGVHLMMDCLLGDLSGLRCYSREDLEEIVNRHGKLATRTLEKLAHAASAYDQFSELRWPYMVLMRKAMLEELCADNAIYHGYSAQLLLPIIRHFVRVRIEAPVNMRVIMTMERLGCDDKAAREYIAEADRSRVKWARFMYGKDIRSPLLYDLNINLGHMTIKAACRMLEAIMGEPDFQATPESRRMVDRLHLAADIEVALVTDPRTEKFEIDADVDDQGIHLTGPYLDDAELDAVLEIARATPGVAHPTYTPGYVHRFETGA